MNPDFKEFVELFNAHGVEYLVVGSYALAAHGHPRYTGDIALGLRRTPENAARAMHAVADFGFGSLGLAAEDLLHPDRVIQLGHPPRRIDLLTSIDGVEFDVCYAGQQSVAHDGVVLPIIGLADFRTNKRVSGRPQDLADLDSLGADRPTD